MNDAVYDLTLERIALIRRMVVAWNGAEPGAPMIHPEAPYGSRDRDGDIANVTGDDDGVEEEHRALEDGIAVFSQNAVLKPGRYQYHNPLAKLDCAAITDVFRDSATGETPEHITFAVTEDHLALIPRLNHMWDDDHGVPRIDPERPYGGTESYTHDMGRHLDGTADQDSLVRLHREMQPAFQIFLRYADLGPGTYRRNAASKWEPA